MIPVWASEESCKAEDWPHWHSAIGDEYPREKVRIFPAIFRAIQPNFSATQTVWRSMQSGTNPSPPEFVRPCLTGEIGRDNKPHLPAATFHPRLDRKPNHITGALLHLVGERAT